MWYLCIHQQKTPSSRQYSQTCPGPSSQPAHVPKILGAASPSLAVCYHLLLAEDVGVTHPL